MRPPLPLGTDQVAGGPKHWHAITKNSRERAEREKRLTHFHLLDEAAAACLAEPDPKKLKNKLHLLLMETIDAIADVDLGSESSEEAQRKEVVATYQVVVDSTIKWMRDRTGAIKNG